MARAIGLDIGSRCIKLVEIEGSPKKYKVTRFVSRDIPGDGGIAEGEVVAETIAAVLNEARAVRDSVVTTVDSRTVVIREIMIPFLQDDQIRRVLRFEAEAHLHNYAIEDVVVDYVKVGEIGEESKVLIFAAPKAQMRERLAMLKSAGIDPMNLDLELAALFNAAESAGAFEEHPNSVLIDMGANTTTIIFVRDGKLKACRTLRTGAESITRVLSQDLAVDSDSARERAKQGDDAPRDDDLLKPLDLDPEEVPETEKSASELENAIVVQRQDDFVTRIHREASRSIATYAAGRRMDAIYLTGGASLVSGTRRRLEERFGAPTIRLDFLGDDKHKVSVVDQDQTNAQLGVGIGCALKSLGYDGLDLEFRREDLRYTRKFDLIKVALASTVSLVFILLFLTWLNYQNRLKRLRNEHREARNLVNTEFVIPAKARYKEVLGEDLMKKQRIHTETKDPFTMISRWNTQILKMHRHITSDLGYDVKDVPAIRSALGVWKDLSLKLGDVRRQLGFLVLDNITVNQTKITVDGELGNRTNVDEIVKAMKLLDYVETVERRAVSENSKTGKFKFGLTAKLKPMLVKKGGR